jgi:predicted DNA-binding transcriptional regulator AlpA
MNTPQIESALLPASSVWTRFGVVDRTLDRWLEKASLGFPRPIVINRRRYFRESEIVAWERMQAAVKSVAA